MQEVRVSFLVLSVVTVIKTVGGFKEAFFPANVDPITCAALVSIVTRLQVYEEIVFSFQERFVVFEVACKEEILGRVRSVDIHLFRTSRKRVV